MTKSEMIDLVINEFIKDKDLIKKNLVQAMDTITLVKEENGCRVSLVMKWEVLKNGKNSALQRQE